MAARTKRIDDAIRRMYDPELKREATKKFSRKAQDRMQITVDLRTRILPADHSVFIARPGRESRLYKDFLEKSTIGLELPGIRLQRGKSIREQPDIENQLKKALAIRHWATAGKPEGGTPSASIKDYERQRKTRGHTQFISILSGFFENAQKGDLLVIPPSPFADDAVLAEFRDDPDEIHYIHVPRYGRFTLPARRIKRFAAIEKRKLPSPMLDVIAKPQVFVLVGKSSRPFLYDLVYGSYVISGDYNTRIDVTSETYDINDDIFLLAFLKFVAVNTKTVTFDKKEDIQSIYKAAFQELGEYAPILKTNINSPGALSLKSPYIIPLVTAVMLALAIEVGPEAVEAAEAGKIVIGNSSAPDDDPCAAEIEESVLTQIRLFGLGKWPQACEFARKVARETGLQANPTVVKEK